MSWSARALFSALAGRGLVRSTSRVVCVGASACVAGGAAYAYASSVSDWPRTVSALRMTEAEKLQQHVFTDHKLTKRELCFLEYASIEYDDVIYMSPMDFIDSLTRDKPRERIYRRVMKRDEVSRILRRTPPLRKASRTLFRNLDQNGLISYADYIFLIMLLTKSKEAFKIAFLMFDDDESGTVDKEEFLLIRSLISTLRSSRNASKTDQECQLDMSEFKFVVQHFHDKLFMGSDYNIAFSKSEEEVKREDTTLLLHLFGLRGREVMALEDFMIFYDNLQYEIMEIEFREFARGKTHIAPVDFAWLMLRYTMLSRDEYASYVDRVMKRCDDEERWSITLDQWASFSIFLNNLNEFARAVRLYTNADMHVSKAEFARAVQCTSGEKLDDVVVDLIFAIFDENDDGKLSYKEFLSVMNDRLHRGLKTRSDKGWNLIDFKRCVLAEMNKPS